MNFVSLKHGLELCCKDGLKITSASLQSGECLEYISDKGFYLCGEFIGKTDIETMNYFEKERWALQSKWYVQTDC